MAARAGDAGYDQLHHFVAAGSWTSDPERMARGKVPADRHAALTKPEIAIAEIDRVKAAGARFG